MFVTCFFRKTIGPLSSRKGDFGGQVCPDGHLMHPSWDLCPYCEQVQQGMPGSMSPGGETMPEMGMPGPAAGEASLVADARRKRGSSS